MECVLYNYQTMFTMECGTAQLFGVMGPPMAPHRSCMFTFGPGPLSSLDVMCIHPPSWIQANTAMSIKCMVSMQHYTRASMK